MPLRRGGHTGRNLGDLCCRGLLTVQVLLGKAEPLSLGRPLTIQWPNHVPITWTQGMTVLHPCHQRTARTTALASRLLYSGVCWASASICALLFKQMRKPGCSQVEKCQLYQPSWGSAGCKALTPGKTHWHPKASGWKCWYLTNWFTCIQAGP